MYPHPPPKAVSRNVVISQFGGLFYLTHGRADPLREQRRPSRTYRGSVSNFTTPPGRQVGCESRLTGGGGCAIFQTLRCSSSRLEPFLGCSKKAWPSQDLRVLVRTISKLSLSDPCISDKLHVTSSANMQLTSESCSFNHTHCNSGVILPVFGFES